MRIAFGVILVTAIFGGFFGNYVLALPLAFHHVLPKDLDTTVDQMYKTYVSVSNDRVGNSNEMNVISQMQQLYVDGPRESRNGKQPNRTQTAYLLVKTMRQRNKRYTSSLTLCHFKICNMGRKRNIRFFPMIRRPDDDNESL